MSVGQDMTHKTQHNHCNNWYVSTTAHYITGLVVVLMLLRLFTCCIKQNILPYVTYLAPHYTETLQKTIETLVFLPNIPFLVMSA